VKEEIMKVRELIAILSEKDPDARVFVMMEQRYPFECRLAGVAVREDFDDRDDDEDEGPQEAADTGQWDSPRERRNDVFLLEGGQIRYGSKGAWEVAQTEP
jgi:hypothetical protein